MPAGLPKAQSTAPSREDAAPEETGNRDSPTRQEIGGFFLAKNLELRVRQADKAP